MRLASTEASMRVVKLQACRGGVPFYHRCHCKPTTPLSDCLAIRGGGGADNAAVVNPTQH
jgi:hypothetical protein